MSAHPTASIIIRAYNEGRHLEGVLRRVGRQRVKPLEVILVDSGSTDGTVGIAERHGCRIVRIDKADFTFGRSLNVGCRAALGNVLVFLSGHCYPQDDRWLDGVLAPFSDQRIGLVYGRQRGGRVTRFSEHRHFAKTFPRASAIPQEGFFCNNANCAIRRSLWQERPFDEALTGLEDLEWARWMATRNYRAAYSAEAGVFHIHEEKWPQVFRRYEREAIALKQIFPDFTFSLFDFARLFAHSAVLDLGAARQRGQLLARTREIIAFRACQYWGTYRGAHYHRKLTRAIKEKFYYPTR